MLCVRHARQGDEPEILRCLAAAFAPFRDQYTSAAFADTVLTPETLHQRMTTLDVFVAEDEQDGVVGTVAAGDRGGVGRVRGMAVSPAWQRRGVAARLLRRALDELIVLGCRRATLGTTAPLVDAARLYTSAGFVPTGTVRDFFGMPLQEHELALDAGVTIREARPQDAPAILRIVNAAYVVERDFVTGDRLGEFELREHFDRGTFLVVERNGVPHASVFLERLGDGRMYLGLLAVDPAEQRTGLGRLTMAAAERRCRDSGIRAIDILIVSLRTELPPFYGGRGFLPTGTRPFEDPRLFRPAHFITMTLAL